MIKRLSPEATTLLKKFANTKRPIHWGHVQFRKNFSEKTDRTTLEICMWAKRRGLEFACEVYSKNDDLRADVIIPALTWPVIEIMDSESKESIDAKKVKYDDYGVWMLPVPANFVQAIALIEKENGFR